MYDLPDHDTRLRTCLRNLERAIDHYTSDDPRAQDGRDPAMTWIKEMRRELAVIVQEIVNHEFNTARSGVRVDTSDTMPCVMTTMNGLVSMCAAFSGSRYLARASRISAGSVLWGYKRCSTGR